METTKVEVWKDVPNYKGIYKGKSHGVFNGKVFVDKIAQKTNAYQANRNLMLSKTARADSIPGLEIEADDVRCTHGATAGQIPDEYTFYLMARGIDRGNAERMIIQGFFEEVIDRIAVQAGGLPLFDISRCEASSVARKPMPSPSPFR